MIFLLKPCIFIQAVGHHKKHCVKQHENHKKAAVMPARGQALPPATGRHYCRIVFDGNSSFEPVVSNMVLECKAPVNIMFADTKDIDGKAYGQMILQLPEDERAAKRALAYLETQNVHVEEGDAHAFT